MRQLPQDDIPRLRMEHVGVRIQRQPVALELVEVDARVIWRLRLHVLEATVAGPHIHTATVVQLRTRRHRDRRQPAADSPRTAIYPLMVTREHSPTGRIRRQYPPRMATIRDLAAELKVPMGDVIKALMSVGVTRTANQGLPAEDVELVKKQLQARPPSPPPREDGGAFGDGVREPRRPRPPTLSGEAAATEEA